MEEINNGIKVIKVLKQVMDALRQNMKHQFKEMNLTGSQGMLVGTLVHYGDMKITDLSEKLGLSNSTVSGIVDRLEEQGLVERIRSKEDRRVVYVALTSEFKKRAKEHFQEMEKGLETIMNKATPQELKIILEGLVTLKKVMEKQKD